MFNQIRNENKRKNYIYKIALINFDLAKHLADEDSHKIKAHAEQYNQKISAETGMLVPLLQPFGN